MSQRLAPIGREVDHRAANIAIILLRTTLLGTLAAFVAALAVTTWRVIGG